MFFQELLKYFENNLTQVAILGVCGLLLLVSIIGLIAVSIKAKREAALPAWIRESKSLNAVKPNLATMPLPGKTPVNPQVQEAESVTDVAEAPTEAAESATEKGEAAEAKPEASTEQSVSKNPTEEQPSAEQTAEEATAETKPATENTSAEEDAKGKVLGNQASKKTKINPPSIKSKGTKAAKSALAATKRMGEANMSMKEPAPTPTPIPKLSFPFKKQKQKEEPIRYAGKWVVCKLVLSDADGNVLEENYFFELRASNGEQLLASEEYTSYAGAVKGIQTHKDNAIKGNFRIVLSKKGDYIFKLLSAKNTLLCTGANYKTLEGCESAIASTKRFAQTAVLQEDMEELHVKLPPEEDTPEPELPENGYTGKWIISTKGNEEVGVMYYFELFASNGEKLLTSEEYTTYEGAINAVETHKANIAKDNFRITITKRGDYLFKLLGGNGQLLCLGEHYKTRSRCENAVESVKQFSKSAPVLEYGEIRS